MADEYIQDADEYYDLQHYGLINEKGKVIPHVEQHEFMLGYRDCGCEKRRAKSDLDTIMMACMATVAASSACCS